MKADLILHDFIEHWGDVVKVERICEPVFVASIKYKSARGVLLEQTKVYIVRNGYEAGKVCLAETSKLKASRFHLDFVPDFQRYSLTKKKNLKLSGSSEKMGGEYTVIVSPKWALPRKEYP